MLPPLGHKRVLLAIPVILVDGEGFR